MALSWQNILGRVLYFTNFSDKAVGVLCLRNAKGKASAEAEAKQGTRTAQVVSTLENRYSSLK